VRVCSLLLLVVMIFSSTVLAQEFSLTTDTASSQFATLEEKIAFLERYLELPSEAKAAEYHIVYHDNSSGRVPGPSDWDMRVVVKVESEAIPLWLESLKATEEPFDLSWAFALVQDWHLESSPKFFTGDKRVAVFEVEGVVVLWLSTF
jgi:hypothetical protein